MDKNGGIWGWVPDMDHDGDHDVFDFVLYDDIILSDEEEHKTRSDDFYDDDEDDFDSDEEWDDDSTDNFINIDARVEFPEKNADDPDPFMDLEEEPDGDKVEDQKYQRELSAHYIAQRQKQADNIVRAVALGKYEPYSKKDYDLLKFIADNQCVASRYLTRREFYLLSSAISDHFDLPFAIPAELDCVKYHFQTLFQELAENDLDQTFQIWEWCLDTFQPYWNFTDHGDDLTSGIFHDKDNLPDEFLEFTVKHMETHPDFVDKVILNGIDIWRGVSDLILIALERENVALAKRIFESLLLNKATDIHNKILVISALTDDYKYYEAPSLLEQFRKDLFPLVREQTDPRIKNKIPKWEKKMRERLGEDEKE